MVPFYVATVAHNCHGKTKSHGTPNLTHGKNVILRRNKINSRQNTINSRQNKITHGRTPIIHGKTKCVLDNPPRVKTKFTDGKQKTRVGQRFLFAFAFAIRNDGPCNSNTLLAQTPPFLVQCPGAVSRAHDVLQLALVIRWSIKMPTCTTAVVMVRFLIYIQYSYLHLF